MLYPLSRALAEWAAFETILRDASLPTEDLDSAGQHFFALDTATAFGGHFIAGPDAMLRSVAVPAQAQGRGLGRTVVLALLRQLEGHGVKPAWLLTTTAGPFFARLGFAPADRQSVPAAISATPQFQGTFRAFSAGSYPKGHLHAETVDLLTKLKARLDAIGQSEP